MQKIMFNDQYGLTKAVLDGKKTQTRRLALRSKEDVQVLDSLDLKPEDKSIVQYIIEKYSRFKVGETVAVAQCLKDLGYDGKDKSNGHIWGLDKTPAWTNKMFMSSKECKHHIRITGIRLERLQDISNEDCLKEGIQKCSEDHRIGYPIGVPFNYFICEDKKGNRYTTPKEAYAALIDKVSDKGTWERNPWVFVYDFELVK